LGTNREQFWQDYEHHLNHLLTEYNIHVHTDTCWKYLARGEKKDDSHCRMGITGEVQLTTHFDEEDGSIKVKKTHGRMNYFNGLLTFLLKCNSDVKFIASGGDVTSLMYYVTDYITKAPMTMHAGLAALSYSIRRAEERMDALALNTGASEGAVRKATILPAMTMAVNSMMGRQEISQQQIMNYIVGGGDCYTNERFQTFNWGEVLRYVNRAFQGEDGLNESTLQNSEETMSLNLNADG
ncbi:hypothetical protein BKA70DRAFT_1030521, partial [Coprinopsis sp. MPI-PUGE-AT-0042]